MNGGGLGELEKALPSPGRSNVLQLARRITKTPNPSGSESKRVTAYGIAQAVRGRYSLASRVRSGERGAREREREREREESLIEIERSSARARVLPLGAAANTRRLSSVAGRDHGIIE
jgi:hypothetical protein